MEPGTRTTVGNAKARPYFERSGLTIFAGDTLEVLREMDSESVNCVVTSPPYWGLRDYGVVGQMGLEKTPQEYVAKMVEVFREVRRVLRKDGTCWVNLGDSYVGGGFGGHVDNKAARGVSGRACNKSPELKPKDLCGIPWRVAFALQDDGWYLRQDIIWNKPNPMPESVTDRCTKAHEYLFLLTKSARYYYDTEAIKEESTGQTGLAVSFERETKECLAPGQGYTQHRLGRAAGNKTHKTVAEYERSDSEEHRTAAGLLKIADTAYAKRNKRSVWEIATQPYAEAHFATYPEKLVEPCILAGCPAGGVVLDPFGGSMTTLFVAQRLQCKGIAIELNPEYIEIGLKRFTQDVMQFHEGPA